MEGIQSRSIFKNAYRSDIMRLIIICSGLFVFLWFIEITFLMTEAGTAFFIKYMKEPLLLPLDMSAFLKQPWSLLTFGFMENNFWNLFTNMVWVWIFGTVIEDLRGTNRVLPIFWFGSLFAGVLLLVVNGFTHWGSGLYMSTLGGIGAVAAAALTYKPGYIFYAVFKKGIPIYIFGILFLTLTIYIRWGDHNSFVMLLAGSLIGYLSQNLLYGPFEKIKTSLTNFRTYVSSNDNFIKNKKASNDSSKQSRELNMNDILDKMNIYGSESLSAEEKDYLIKYEH